GGLHIGAGVAHHLLRDAGALALRIAAFAGTETVGLRLIAGAEKADVLAQGPRRRATGAAVHAHRRNRVEKIAGRAVRLTDEDLLPEHVLRHSVDAVCVFHGTHIGMRPTLAPSVHCGDWPMAGPL